MSIKLIIFDLDGTLVNPLEDIAEAANLTLKKNGFPTHPIESYPQMIGGGLEDLMKKSLPANVSTDGLIHRLRQDFMDFYQSQNHKNTKAYEGILEMLATLRQKGIILTVASNKYHEGTVELVKEIFGDFPFRAVYGQRKGVAPKPDPSVAFDILNETGIKRENAMFVGDSQFDIHTGRNAGIKSVGVTWGYRDAEDLMKAKPDYLINQPNELVEIVEKINEQLAFKGIHHVAIICQNYEISKKFYTEVLGLEIIAENFRRDRGSFKLDLALNGKYVVELVSFPRTPLREPGPEPAGLRHLAFSVEDLDDTIEKLRKKSITVEPIRVDEYTGKRFTFFKDPDGLPLEWYEG